MVSSGQLQGQHASILHPAPPTPLTFLISGSSVEDLDGSADVQVEQSYRSCSLPVSLLLQRAQEHLHVDVGPPADPATQLQGQAAFLASVPQNIRLPVRTTPAPTALCCA